MRSNTPEHVRIVGLLGVALDGRDGHERLTQTDEFLLVGGSAETHERMQETAMLFQEALERRGKNLADTDIGEVIELLCEGAKRFAENKLL